MPQVADWSCCHSRRGNDTFTHLICLSRPEPSISDKPSLCLPSSYPAYDRSGPILQNSTGTETFMLLRVLVVIAVLIAGVFILAATKPETFTIQRATTIAAPP